MSVKSRKSGKKKSSKKLSGFEPGDQILFHPKASGKPARRGEYVRLVETGVAEVKLSGDPFTVCVSSSQITPASSTSSPSETEREVHMPSTDSKPSAKELRRKAKQLGIADWEELSLKALTKAVADAEAKAAKKGGKKASKKAAAPVVVEDDTDEDTDDEDEDEAPAPKKSKKSSKKSASKKAAAKKSSKKAAAADEDEDEELPENGNPFRSGSNMYFLAEEVIKGGKRSKMVARLKKKITLAPRTESDDYDEDAELDRRLLIVGQMLRNQYGFEVTREGRGFETGTIVATKN